MHDSNGVCIEKNASDNAFSFTIPAFFTTFANNGDIPMKAPTSCLSIFPDRKSSGLIKSSAVSICRGLILCWLVARLRTHQHIQFGDGLR